jgi:SAM-dependent methyltransferase
MARMTAAHALGWQIDEVAVAGRENLDPAHVARYDAKEDAGAPGEVALLRRLGVGPDAVVVDIGTGTGQFAVAAARVWGRVVAVDVSPVMLRRLRAAVAAAAATNVEVVHAGFLTYRHEGPARRPRLLPLRAPPPARLLEGGGAVPGAGTAPARRAAAAVGRRLRVRAGRGRRAR